MCPQPTKLLPGVVTSVGDLVRVVVGEQGVDWTWTHGGDSGISGLHNDSQQATLQVRSRVGWCCLRGVTCPLVRVECVGAQYEAKCFGGQPYLGRRLPMLDRVR